MDAGIAKAGTSAIIAECLIKISVAIILSPLLGMLLALLVMILALWIVEKRAPYPTECVFNKFQFVSSALYSLDHGDNDAENTMGIMTVLLFANGYQKGFDIQYWVVIACRIAMNLCTLFGGWRIVRTIGMGITHIRLSSGFVRKLPGRLRYSLPLLSASLFLLHIPFLVRLVVLVYHVACLLYAGAWLHALCGHRYLQYTGLNCSSGLTPWTHLFTMKR